MALHSGRKVGEEFAKAIGMEGRSIKRIELVVDVKAVVVARVEFYPDEEQTAAALALAAKYAKIEEVQPDHITEG